MKILNGTRDGRARESRHTGDECNTSSPQLFGIDGSDKVLLSLIQVGEQRSVFLLKFFLFAHTVSITRGASFVTIIILQALAEDAEPVPDLAAGDPQQLGHLVPGASLVDPPQGGEPLEDAAVAGLSPPFLDLLALLGTQRDGLHRSPPGRWRRPQPTP